AADDEEIRPHHPRAEHRIDVLGVGADGGDQPARAIDADALQHFLAAGVRLDAERALFERRVQPFGAALDDDIGDALAAELVGDDAADAAVAADDEVILDGFEHAFLPPPLQPLGKAAFHDYRGQQREGIQRRADAG